MRMHYKSLVEQFNPRPQLIVTFLKANSRNVYDEIFFRYSGTRWLISTASLYNMYISEGLTVQLYAMLFLG